jgi:hypothetical protein
MVLQFMANVDIPLMDSELNRVDLQMSSGTFKILSKTESI